MSLSLGLGDALYATAEKTWRVGYVDVLLPRSPSCVHHRVLFFRLYRRRS
jgi:hypothetical protein